MTDTSVQVLQIDPDAIDTTLREAVHKIHVLAAQHQIPYFLAGATAREILLHHVFGLPQNKFFCCIHKRIKESDKSGMIGIHVEIGE
jgi:hypothetical protein